MALAETPMQSEDVLTIYEKSKPGRRAAALPAADVPERPLEELIPAKLLRSEPPRPKSELLALVLFGTADGANPTPPPAGKQPDGTQKAAYGIGGGYAAQGLTEALDDLAGIEATARIDTTSSRNPRPEVEFQVSSRVSVAFSHVIGTPPVTEPPDKNLARIEWRFRANWAFESTTGDRGRQLFDLIWTKRY